MMSTYETCGTLGPVGPMGVDEYIQNIKHHTPGPGYCMGPKTKKRREGMPRILGNGGGVAEANNKRTTIGRPQHMYKCRVGANEAGVIEAWRNVRMSSGRGGGRLSTSWLDEDAPGRRLSCRPLDEAAPLAPDPPWPTGRSSSSPSNSRCRFRLASSSSNRL